MRRREGEARQSLTDEISTPLPVLNSAGDQLRSNLHNDIELANVECQVVPIEIEDYPLRAVRPANTVLNKGKIKRDFNVTIPYWRDSLRACLNEMQMASQ